MFELQDVIFLTILFFLPTIWCLSYSWYYFEVTNNELIKKIFGKVKSIPIRDIRELSYESNPARPLVYVIFNKPNGGEDYIEFTTGVWSPHTLYSLNEALQSKNSNINVKFDEKTKKNFEEDRNYHLGHPKSMFGWIILGLKQLLWGVALGVLLILILKYL